MLLPKVICSGREWQRQLRTVLNVSGLPNSAKPPFQLLSVQQSGTDPWWEPGGDCGCRGQMMYHVFIPVCCCIRDACGAEFHCPSVVEMDACLHLNCPSTECWRHNLIMVPCVRLVCGPVCSNDPCFEVVLEVVLEIFLTHWEVFGSRPNRPPCPDMPLYPQPCKDPYTS